MRQLALSKNTWSAESKSNVDLLVDIGALIHLEHLSLLNNGLTCHFPSLKELANMRELILSGNTWSAESKSNVDLLADIGALTPVLKCSDWSEDKTTRKSPCKALNTQILEGLTFRRAR